VPPWTFPREEYEARWAKVEAALRASGHDIALVWGKTAGSHDRSGDLLYLTGYGSTQSGQEPDSPLWNARSLAAVILQVGREPTLHADDANVDRDRVAAGAILAHADPVAGVAADLTRRRPSGRVLFVGTDTLPVKYMRQLQRLAPGLDFIDDDDLVRRVRTIKSPRELELFRTGGRVVAEALDALAEGLVAGQPHNEAQARAAGILVRGGLEWRRLIVNHGATLHRLEREPVTGISFDAPKPGDMVRAWIDGILAGYWFDPGRTAVCGRASSAQRALTEQVVSICDELRAAITPGARVRDVALKGDALIAATGHAADIASQSWPYHGHGNGCLWEPPIIHKDCCDPDETFEAGMVIGVECFLAEEGVGVAGYEDNLIITPTGTELITPARRLWW
jgi:Xaa-Pro aminopeptidase